MGQEVFWLETCGEDGREAPSRGRFNITWLFTLFWFKLQGVSTLDAMHGYLVCQQSVLCPPVPSTVTPEKSPRASKVIAVRSAVVSRSLCGPYFKGDSSGRFLLHAMFVGYC